MNERKENKLFYLPSQFIPKGSFTIHEAPLGIKEDAVVRLKESDIIFYDDGTLAGDFFGLGIIQGMVKKDKTVVIACNPKDLNELE